MAPTSALPAPDRPTLLNEKFKVQSYDGGSFKGRTQYDVKNALIPIMEPFHCSGSGRKFNLILKCSEDFTLTHFYISGPGPRCTEPIKSGLVWVTDSLPEVEAAKEYDSMSSQDLMEVMKGIRSVGSADAAKGLPDPCVYFTTDPTTRESESELSRWREGKYVMVKFFDTHKDGVNIDVGIIALIGFFGRRGEDQKPLGPWMKREVQQVWVHPNPLRSMFSSSGWVCDGRDFTGGCRSGQTDFHQTNVYTVTFRCTTSGFDLCEKCAYDPSLGQVTESSIASDLEALADPAMCKLGVTRLRNLWKRNWLVTLPRYMQHGLLDTLVAALQKHLEGGSSRPDEERMVQRQQMGGPETQKRQVRRALLQFTSELTQRLLSKGPIGDINVNDLVWGLCSEPEEHWDEGRIIRLPEALPDGLGDTPEGLTEPVDSAAPDAALGAEAASAPSSARAKAAAVAPEALFDAAVVASGASTPGSARAKANVVKSDPRCYLVSWRDGQAHGRVQPRSIWKITFSADEDIMMATANLFLEVSKGQSCDLEKVSHFMKQNADLSAIDGQGITALHAAVKSEVNVDVIETLLNSGACPEVSNWEAITPLHQNLQLRAKAAANGASTVRFDAVTEVLRRNGAVQPDDFNTEEQLKKLRESFTLKMLGALLTLQSAILLPVEVLEIIHLFFRELDVGTLKQALEPQTLHAFTALLQHFVGGTDNINTALVGCKIMRAAHKYPDSMLRYLVQSHGALRWAQRLAVTKDFAQCGLYRQLQHEKVAPDALSKEAKLLCDELAHCASDATETLPGSGQMELLDGQDSHTTRLAQIANALDMKSSQGTDTLAAARAALLAFRELLKKTEKGSLSEERCTAYELEQFAVPGKLLQFLKDDAPSCIVDPIRQPSMNAEHWKYFREVFSDQSKQARKGLARLFKAIHAVIESGEVFPVWRHKRERGLKVLTEALPLKLRHLSEGVATPPFFPKSMASQVSVMVEPLVPVAELSRYLMRVTPIADEQYLAWCHKLVGATVREQTSGVCYKVLSFEILHSELPLPIHVVSKAGAEDPQRMLLSMRDYLPVSAPTDPVSLLDFKVALSLLHVVSGASGFLTVLDELASAIRGEVDTVAKTEQSTSTECAQAVQHALQKASQAAAVSAADALTVLAAERRRIEELSAGQEEESSAAGAAGGQAPVDPTMRVHTVMIAVSDEIPFELFWPMVRDDIVGAIRELLPRALNANTEEAVQAGVVQNGMGPIAKRLTLEEAETLAARVGHVVQTAVIIDQQAVQDVQRERAKSTQSEAIQVSNRVQFSSKSGDNWVPGVVVGHGPPRAQSSSPPDRFDLIDDQGVLVEKLPRSRVRIPPGKRESPSSMGSPLQPVLSQSDLVRIREHLRRRQEEWAERHAALGASVAAAAVASGTGTAGSSAPVAGPAASASAGPRADSASTGAAAQERPSASRPTSAPAITQRPRAVMPGSAESPPGSAGRRADFLSRDGSLGDVDVNDPLEMVHYVEDEVFENEEFDDDGDGAGEPGEEGEEDDEDLPPLEPSEAGDSQADAMPVHRLGSARSREGDGDAGASMEQELRVLEQLRAMEQIISEVLDPQEVAGRVRRAGNNSEDLLGGAPLTNLRIRMGSGEGVQTYAIRRMSGSRGSDRAGGSHPVEAMRGEFPAFVRAADSANPTSSLDHPVVERFGAADLLEEEEPDADASMEPFADVEEVVARVGHPHLCVRFCLCPPVAASTSPQTLHPAGASGVSEPPAAEDTVADPTAAAMTDATPQIGTSQPLSEPIVLPSTWNLMKAMQFLHDQQHASSRVDREADESGGAAASVAVSPPASVPGAPACMVQALQKVSLENWSLGYAITVTAPKGEPAGVSQMSCSELSPTGAAMEVDATASQDSPVKGFAVSQDDSPAPGRGHGHSSGLPAKKRRRTQLSNEAPDEVAREMYSRFATELPASGGEATGPHQLIARCGENSAVTDAIELLHLLKAHSAGIGVEPSQWVSAKLDKKLRYQLEDPLSVVSGTLPMWCTTLPRLCPFLFSLKTRKMLLKYTAFGPSFAVHWTQDSKVGSFLRRRATVQTELNAQTDPRKMQELSQELSNIEEHVVKSSFWLGTLQSTLVKMQKGDTLLRQSDIAMELVCNSSRLVEVQFDGETGFGSAVTQSFYVEVAQMLQDRAINRQVPMWLEDNDSTNSQYLLCRRGLVIRALMDGPQRNEAVRRFRFLGRLMGQALREGFIVPLPLAEDFFALVLGERLGPANFPHPGNGSAGELCGILADFAADLARGEAALGPDCSPEVLQAFYAEQGQRLDFGDRFLAHDHTEGAPAQKMSFNQYVAMLDLCFLETGLSGAPLREGGETIPITVDNVCEFVKQAALFWFDHGVSAQVEAFRAGLNDVFPFECLVAFTRSELREMFCGEDRIDWDEQALLSHLHPVGGLTDESPPYKFLVKELLELSQAERARFLDFVSSCPRLPPGGIAKFHVDVFPDSISKQGYPRSRACANQLYLPPYASKEELHEKLHEAMHCSAGHHEQRVRDM